MAFIVIIFFAAVIGIMPVTASASDKTTIGAVEDVVIMPQGIRIPARVDTGAASSSLDVSQYSIDGKYVNLRLSERCGGHKIRSLLVGMKTIRTSDGRTKRPVIKLDICIGSELISTHVTLNNRARMTYPFLLGRRSLQGKFVVDVSRVNIQPPTCPGVNPYPTATPE